MQEYKVEITLGLEGKTTTKWAGTFAEAYDLVKNYVKNDDYDCYITPKNAPWVYEKTAYSYEVFRAYHSLSDFNEIVSIAKRRMMHGNNKKCTLYIN